jgi:hypothetical protein
MVECKYGDPNATGFGDFVKIGGSGGGGGGAAAAAASAGGESGGKTTLSSPMQAALQAAQQPKRVPPRMLPCTKKCEEYARQAAQMERNRALAAALNLSGADTSANLNEPYSELLLAAARDEPKLIATVETALAAFVKLNAAGSGAAQHAFPVMKAAHRQIVHEYAQYYNLLSASYDPEPRRNVVVFRSDLDDPRLPSPLLSEDAKSGKQPAAAASSSGAGAAAATAGRSNGAWR